MSTEIRYQTWDGGEGWNCPCNLIGYCKEEPEEVLKFVLFTHDVYHYKDLYRPIDNGYPNNVTGLYITEFNRDDVQVVKSIKDMDLSIASVKLKRTKDTILKSFELCKRWHNCPTNIKVQERNDKLFKEVEMILGEL